MIRIDNKELNGIYQAINATFGKYTVAERSNVCKLVNFKDVSQLVIEFYTHEARVTLDIRLYKQYQIRCEIDANKKDLIKFVNSIHDVMRSNNYQPKYFV